MREVLFRGKRLDDGKWIEGGITFSLDQEYIFIAPERFSDYDDEICIDKNTLGQFTGLTDKNGKKIFEGDIVKWYAELLIVKYGEHDVVEESNEYGNHFRNVKKFGWYGERVKDMPSTGIDLKTLAVGEVVGNIYDNPGVLEDRL